MENSKFNSQLPLLEVILFFLGVLGASVYGNNDFAYRLSVPLLFLLVGALSVLVRSFLSKGHSCFGGVMLPFSCVLVYFCLRAVFSEVTAFGERDLMLFGGMFCAAVLCLPEQNRAWIGKLAPWLACVALLVQCIPLIWQWGDPTYVPFRQMIAGKDQISGFFGHANFFALFVGLMGLILFSYALGFRLANEKRLPSWRLRSVWLSGWVLSLFLLISSHSRGALVAIIIAHVVSLGGIMLVRGLKSKKNGRSSLVISGISLLTITLLAWLVISFVAEERDLDDNFLFLNSRQDMLLMAADAEPANELIGGGSRFFQYEARRVWDTGRLNNSLNDPRVVHNEYVEALVNYGYIGFFGFLALLVLVVSLFLKNFVRVAGAKDESGVSLPLWIAVGGGLVAIFIQCLVDFTLHVLPLSILLGAMVGCVSYSVERNRRACVSYGAAVLLVAVMLVKLPLYWLSVVPYEQARSAEESHPEKAAEYYLKVGERTGDFAQYEKAGRLLLKVKGTEALEAAYEAFLQAWEKHPNNGVLALNCGKVATKLGKFDEAEAHLGHAIDLVGASELDYGPRTTLAITKYKRLLSSQETDFSALPVEKQIEELRPCMQLLTDSKAFRFRIQEAQAQMRNTIELHFMQLHLVEAARQADGLGAKGEYTKSMAYVMHTQQIYKHIKRLMKTEIPKEYSAMMKIVGQQFQILKKNSIAPEGKLLLQLKSSVTFSPRNRVFSKKKR